MDLFDSSHGLVIGFMDLFDSRHELVRGSMDLVSPKLYGDGYPRFFTYWITDAYQTTGCYNLLCSVFVQTNNRIAIGAAVSPRLSYNGKQFDIGIMIWKVINAYVKNIADHGYMLHFVATSFTVPKKDDNSCQVAAAAAAAGPMQIPALGCCLLFPLAVMAGILGLIQES